MTTPSRGHGTNRPTVLVIIGVAGSGKSTVARELAARLGWEFQEGDELHPEDNRTKMTSGLPLTDTDRQPWLAAVAAWVRRHTVTKEPGVITCSALKRAYRDLLRADGVAFIHLAVPDHVLGQRLTLRTDHFMPRALLESQLATLEPLEDDEPAMVVDARATPPAVVDDIMARFGLHAGREASTEV